MNHAHLLQRSIQPEFLNPTFGALQFGYREIIGTVPSNGEEVLLLAWAVVFADDGVAREGYLDIVTQLGQVDGDGLASTIIEGMPADRIGNLSERSGLLGDVTTIWVTATFADDNAHGAILAALDDSLLMVLSFSSYHAEGEERAVCVIEHLAAAMAERQSGLALPPFADTMARLPILQDFKGLLARTSIRFNRYTVNR